jgi:hypothetical protein
VAAGWLHLLLAALHFDLGQRETAEISRDLALYLGNEAHDPNVVAWAHETVSWFAFFEGRPLDALHYAREGRNAASQNSSGRVMNTMKVAMAAARLGDRSTTEQALEQAAREVATLPRPADPGHHFVFDPPKFDYYAATAYVWLGDAESVRRHVATVVKESSNPAWGTYVPTRVGMASLDLATAVLNEGELDEAAQVGVGALRPFVRYDQLLRAAELSNHMMRRYPRSREAREFKEQLIVARADLALSVGKPTDQLNLSNGTNDQDHG